MTVVIKMKVTRPLVCLDIETTGVWVEKDKIIEIALVRHTPDGKKETFHQRINPGISIPAIVAKLTGISDQEVKGAPFFRQVAQAAFDLIGDADFAGFNIERFDLPVLAREFSEAGIKFEWKERKIYDAQKVFHLNEKRDLSAAHQFYCGKDLEGAHSALADSEAVYKILEKQVEKYGGGEQEISVLEQFQYEARSEFYDEERKFCWWNGKLYPMFGKYARKLPLEDIVKTDPGYLSWVLAKDFSDSVKSIVKAALNGNIPARA
jgi:DNA polymerase-3 subunit epsilon